MNDFMGINIHTILWKDYYSPDADYDHMNISQAFKWVRNYQRWDWLEPTNDDYDWENSVGGEFDEYYRLLNEDGINIVVVPVEVPAWLQSSIHFPVDNGDGSEPNHYRETAEYFAQMSARYGPTGGLSSTRLETEDKVQGLDYIRYFESHNEPNQDWKPILWPANLHGHYLNAVHDGRGVERNGTMPLAGIKQGDPNVVHVAPGLVSNGVDDSYWFHSFFSAGRQAYDIMNIHSYFRNEHLFPPNTWPWPPETIGVSPEYYILESGVDEIQKAIEWRDQNIPGTPVWVTEFGWDTYDNNNSHSRGYAPELAQANYIMRAFPLMKRIGVDKAFLFFDFDPNSTSPQLFSSSGIFRDKDTGYEPKIAYYYLTAMSQAVGEYAYDGATIFGEGDPEVYAYSFSKSVTDKVVMIWCREPDSLVDDGATLANYVFALPNMESCELIVPTDGVIGGVQTSLSVTQSGQVGANVTVPSLSETPVFLKISGTQSLSLNLAPEVVADKDFEVQLPATTATISCDASDEDGAIQSYHWTQLEGPTITIAQATSSAASLSGLVEGNYAFQVDVTDDNGAVSHDVMRLAVTSRTSYSGSPHSIPGLIQAEDFDNGGEGVSYHDTTVGNSKGDYRTDVDVDIKLLTSQPENHYIADGAASEWLEYSVSVAQTGLYSINLNLAAYNADRRIEVLIDGLNISGIVSAVQTNSHTVFASNVAEPVLLTEGEHILRVHFITSGVALDWIDIQPFDDGVPTGEYFHLVNPTSGWASLRIFYEVKWQDDLDVLAGGNDMLEFWVTDESPGLTADWDNLKIAISDTSGNIAEIVIGDYIEGVGINWSQALVPLSVYSTMGVDLQHVRFLEFRSSNASGPIDIGLDEITFSGGSTPFLWYGDSHLNNPLSNNSPITLTIEPNGGLGVEPEYNEAPFVDAGQDVVIRPALDSYTFVSDVYDVDGAVAQYQWIQLSGPTLASVSGDTGADMTIELEPSSFGTYEFRLYATDDSGNTSEDDVTLVYEDTGGYIAMDHTAENWRSFSIFHDSTKDPFDVITGSSVNNTTLDIYFKRFDLGYTIDWTKLFVELNDDDVPAATASAAVADYMSGGIDDTWIKVSIPLSVYGAVNLQNVDSVIIRSGKAGPFYSLGIDEIGFSGGSEPLLWYGDGNADVVFNSSIAAELNVSLTTSGGAAIESL